MCYQCDSYPYQAIGPVSFLWNYTDSSHDTSNLKRSLWLWCHPSCYKELLDQITLAIQQNKQEQRLEISSLTSDENTLLRFSLRGPTSQSVLHRAFTLISERPAVEDVWNKLLSLSSTAVLPRGSVLSLNVGDPRLNRPVLKQRCDNLHQLAAAGIYVIITYYSKFTTYPDYTRSIRGFCNINITLNYCCNILKVRVYVLTHYLQVA